MPTNTDSSRHGCHNIKWAHVFSIRLLMITFGILASLNLGCLYFSGIKLGGKPNILAQVPDIIDNQKQPIGEALNRYGEENVNDKSLDKNLDLQETTTETGPMIPELCPRIPPKLGLVTIANLFDHNFRKHHVADLRPGGSYKSRVCTARQTAAIITPFNGTKFELLAYLNYIHPFLMKQQLEYQIFIVENSNKSTPYSAGQLLNIGFIEALKTAKSWLCIILHSSHLLPMDSRNLYRCTWKPTQLVWKIKANGTLHRFLSNSLGVLAITPDLYGSVNGFPNALGDDPDEFPEFVGRLLYNTSVNMDKKSYGLYKSLRNITDSSLRFKTTTRFIDMRPNATEYQPSLDGLTSLNYQLGGINYLKLYTHIAVSKVWLTRTSKTVIKVMKQFLNETTMNVLLHSHKK